MKIEFPVLESEPLIYFLLHSGVFVLALACVFFILGLWMGAAIWGRYKKQLNNARVEIAGQFQEIAVLKRKLAEQTMRPSSGPLQPPPALLTEILPAVNEIFPERSSSESQTRPPTLSSRSMPSAASARSSFESSVAPALAPLSLASDLAPSPAAPSPAPAPAKPIPVVPAFAPAPTAAPIIHLTPTPAPLVSVADAEAHADPVLPAPMPGSALGASSAAISEPPANKRKTAAIRRPTVRVKPKKEATEPTTQPALPSALEPDTAPEVPESPEDSEDLAESFLLPDSPEPPPAPTAPSPASTSESPSQVEPEPAVLSKEEDELEPEDEDDDVAPFGFLLGDPPEPATPSMSTLAEILKNAAAEVKSISQSAAAVAAPAPAPLPSIPAIPSVLPEFDPSLGLIYKITPPEKDDLTRIKGIATVLEKRLHDLGIYTWRQIASWEDSHVREFSSRLAFKDRIAREKWVEQARSLNEACHSA
ncbi:hypothetical protein [Brevifollis gellanilyticus]|uniref:Uncharacterized protein n=1 Tax=Brevifollis gellanilyticus TaxID=748831 RepID=A0A512MHV8_9BACT|nr:hypothetical protein [Brevifollis gellanilyticus]GEP46323.1 hypothetical protein BGE01nite_56140 [Brevifollis gellanilyticus]